MGEVKPLILALKDKQALKIHYMPFLKNGGLFVPTSRAVRPGEAVQILLELPDEAEPILINGTLAWRTPVGAQGRKLPGIGVHFSEDEDASRNKIEKLLAGLLDNDKPTHTI